MRNKNTVIFLLIVFSLICAYNLYWTYIQFSLDKERSQLTSAKEALDKKAKDYQWTAADSATFKAWEAFVSDQDKQATYKDAIDQSFTLGLDLQGGMFVTLEIGVDALVKQMASNPRDSALNAAIACANLRQQEEARNFVPIFVECYNEINPNGSLGVTFSNEELEISVSTPDDEVQAKLETEAKAAIDRTFNIIRTRIDQFGVVSPNLQKQESTGRILLELPGVREPERVRELLRSTAKLEFYVTRPWNDAYPVLIDINNKLREIRGLDTPADSTTTEEGDDAGEGDELAADDDEAEPAAGDSLTAADDSSFSTTDIANDSTPFDQLSEAEQTARREEFRRENPLWAVLSPAAYEQFAQTGSLTPMVGASLAKDTAEVNRILAMEEIQAIIPPDMSFAWTFKPTSEEASYYQLIALRTNEEGVADMTGDAVALARQDFDPSNGQAIVTMRMTSEGTNDWGRLTEANVGKHIAVLLDGYVYSFPVVNEAIKGGSSTISGGFEIDEAKDLANVLKAGQLPVPARIEGEETVGPTLGADNIRSGMYSFIGAFIITLLFMAFYYAKSGLVANVALLANLIFILGCSAAFTIVLTLPGIAAVVLTVGMAVDANVLIFERIREELKRDKTLKASIKSGFSNAFSSVMDANITTFLTGVVLYAFGVGPIRGFAVSLMIGIVTSLISALIITRLILDWYANKGKDAINFGSKLTFSMFDSLKVNMISRKKTMYTLSGILVGLSFISFIAIGFKTGVDFKGGRQFIVEFNDASGTPKDLTSGQIEQFRKDLNEAFEGDEPVIKTLRSDNQVMITTAYLVDDREATTRVSELLNTTLNAATPDSEPKIISTSDVGPTVANDIRQAAYLSVIFSLIIIFFYILVRFRKWQYSAGAIVAIFHDVTIVLGVFSLLSAIDLPFSVEINQALIAALLTIIGYSINDTVVVFDRIRENIGEMKASRLSDIYNVSIDQTISRTLITSLTTFMTALMVFLFGGDVIRGFFFSIMIGIIVGTYSSIFVASPISLDLIKRGDPSVDSEKTETRKKKKKK